VPAPFHSNERMDFLVAVLRINSINEFKNKMTS